MFSDLYRYFSDGLGSTLGSHTAFSCNVFLSKRISQLSLYSLALTLLKIEIHINNNVEYYSGLIRKSCHLRRYGLNLKAICQVRDIRQRKTNTLWFHIYVEPEKNKCIETEEIAGDQRWGGEVEGLEEGGQRYKLVIIR